MECVLRASWIWGVGGVYDTTPDRQAIGWIGSQFWGICSEGALRKTGDHVQYVFILTCSLRSACFFCLFVFLVGSGSGDTSTQLNWEVQRTTEAFFVVVVLRRTHVGGGR